MTAYLGQDVTWVPGLQPGAPPLEAGRARAKQIGDLYKGAVEDYSKALRERAKITALSRFNTDEQLGALLTDEHNIAAALWPAYLQTNKGEAPEVWANNLLETIRVDPNYRQAVSDQLQLRPKPLPDVDSVNDDDFVTAFKRLHKLTQGGKVPLDAPDVAKATEAELAIALQQRKQERDALLTDPDALREYVRKSMTTNAKRRAISSLRQRLKDGGYTQQLNAQNQLEFVKGQERISEEQLYASPVGQSLLKQMEDAQAEQMVTARNVEVASRKYLIKPLTPKELMAPPTERPVNRTFLKQITSPADINKDAPPIWLAKRGLSLLSTPSDVLTGALGGGLQAHAQTREDIPDAEITALIHQGQKPTLPRAMGVPVGATAPAKDVLVGMAKGAWQGATTDTFDLNRPRIEAALTDAAEWYRDQATRYVTKKFINETPENRQALIDDITDKLISTDTQAGVLRHPVITDIAAQSVAPAMPVGAILRGAKTVTKAVPGVSAGATKVRQGIAEASLGIHELGLSPQIVPGAEYTAAVGTETAALQAAKQRVAMDAKHGAQLAMVGEQAALRSALNRLPKDARKDVAILWTPNHPEMQAAQERLAFHPKREQILQAMRDVQKKAQDIGLTKQRAGVLSELVDEGEYLTVKKAPLVEEYMPLIARPKDFSADTELLAQQLIKGSTKTLLDAALKNPDVDYKSQLIALVDDPAVRSQLKSVAKADDADELKYALGDWFDGQLMQLSSRRKTIAKTTTGAEIARKKGFTGPWVEDPVAQFKAAEGPTMRAIGLSAAVKQLNETMPDAVVRMPRDIAPAFLAEKAKATGQQWVALPAEHAETWFRLTAKPGDKFMKGEASYASKGVAMQLSQLMPVLTDTTRGKRFIRDLAGKARYWSWGPVMDSWKFLNTAGAAVVGLGKFWTQNYLGAAGLSVTGLGLRTLDPALHADALQVAWLAALGDVNQGKKTLMALDNGAELSFHDAVKIGQKYGVLNQSATKFDVSAGSSWAQPALAKLAASTGIHQLNNLVDNYQHSIFWLEGLKKFGADPTGIVKAVEYTHKYSGLYSRLSPFERNVLRDPIPFLSWKKTAWRNALNSVLERPEVIRNLFLLQNTMSQHQARKHNVDPLMLNKWQQFPPAIAAEVPWKSEQQKRRTYETTRPEQERSVKMFYEPEGPLGILKDLQNGLPGMFTGPFSDALRWALVPPDPRDKAPEERETSANIASKFASEASKNAAYQRLEEMAKAYEKDGEYGRALEIRLRSNLHKFDNGAIDYTAGQILNAFGYESSPQSLGLPFVPGTAVDTIKTYYDNYGRKLQQEALTKEEKNPAKH